MALGVRQGGCPRVPSAGQCCPPGSRSPVPSESQRQTQTQTPPPTLACQAAPLIPHATGIKGARFHCDVFSSPVSLHPRNKLPCQQGFEASQEMARSFPGLENCGCFWLCLKTDQSARAFLGSTLSAPVPLLNAPEDRPNKAPQTEPRSCFLPFPDPGFRA